MPLYKALCCGKSMSDKGRNKEMPQNPNISDAALLFMCLICAGADKAVHSFPNMFWFYFSSVQMMGCERLFCLYHASKLYKGVFDLWNPISSIVSSSYCGILKVRSERPFDNYRKTFWFITLPFISFPAEVKTKHCIFWKRKDKMDRFGASSLLFCCWGKSGVQCTRKSLVGYVSERDESSQAQLAYVPSTFYQTSTRPWNPIEILLLPLKWGTTQNI